MSVTDKTSRRAFLSALAIAPVLASAAQLEAQPPGETFNARGVVRAIRRERSSITIRHEDIPGVMRAMTMPFRVARSSMLDGLSVGDRVEFVIRRVDGRFVILSIRAL